MAETKSDWQILLDFVKAIEGQIDRQRRAKSQYDDEMRQHNRVKVEFERYGYNDEKELAPTRELMNEAVATAKANAREKAAAKYYAATLDAADAIRQMRVMLPNLAAKACINLMLVADEVETAPCEAVA